MVNELKGLSEDIDTETCRNAKAAIDFMTRSMGGISKDQMSDGVISDLQYMYIITRNGGILRNLSFLSETDTSAVSTGEVR